MAISFFFFNITCITKKVTQIYTRQKKKKKKKKSRQNDSKLKLSQKYSIYNIYIYINNIKLLNF